MMSTSIKQHVFYHNSIKASIEYRDYVIKDLYDSRDECGISYESCELEEDSARHNCEREIAHTMYLAFTKGVYVEGENGWSNYEEYAWDPLGESDDELELVKSYDWWLDEEDDLYTLYE